MGRVFRRSLDSPMAYPGGAVQTGPAVPARKPDIIDCHGSRTFPSPSCFFPKRTSKLEQPLTRTQGYLPPG
ncbi:Hypothetical predicted protein [Prunus dulcis]|nr:Hypothetical predicted protein [Prunus dulcis]